ncbi:GntR family transcriptional regulator [Leeia sp. TBRC 13508]|uniref:GntR family transcriptional regulator n=1 Tax=Leeia speluncae TaxID=2884804 RepID=A0ABS8D1K6_9NEIS|nr:GntR family transcriptional regulator [Leeia speluncae]MCB6182084.1 GntR family transcriptional regulator [Leeia speluncae]
MDNDEVNFLQEDAPQGADRKLVLGQILKKRIITMELAPGAVLEESALSNEFGLSRPPVRELLRQLAAEGYIELEANRGARVATMDYSSLRNFFLAAPLIYIATTKLAALNATKDEIAQLRQIQEKFKEAVASNSINDRVFYNDQFHLLIGKMARNAYLMPSLKRLLIDHARLGKTFYQPHTASMHEDLASAVKQHDEIIAAIESKNAPLAADLVKEHFELSRRNMAMFVAPEGIEVPTDF